MKNILTLLIVTFTLLGATPAVAHPHAWIDVTVEVLTDNGGRVTGLRQSWHFDEGYSAFTLEALRSQFGNDVPQEALNGLAAENLENLADYGWFTKLTQDGKGQPFVPPDSFAQTHVNSQLIMQFDLMLAKPLAAQNLSWQIYDPGYYIEMLYQEGDGAITLPDTLNCRILVEEPNPTEEMVMQAALLDKTQKAEDGLGALFAQKAVLACD